MSRPKRNLDDTLVYKYVYNGLIRLWRESIRAFVKEATKYIVIDTGMSYASLLPLAAQVRIRNIIESGMIGVGRPKKGFKNLSGSFADNNAPYKSKALGESLGKDAYNIEFGTFQNPQFRFQFHLVVFQYFLHDEPHYSHSGNWRSIPKARQAFLDTFNAGLKTKKYLDEKVIAQLLIGMKSDVPITDFTVEEI